jgi:hypothetical protein
MLAQLASVTANFGMRGPKTPLAPKDFMPSQWAKQSKGISKKRRRGKPRKQVGQEIHGIMRHFQRVFNGGRDPSGGGGAGDGQPR